MKYLAEKSWNIILTAGRDMEPLSCVEFHAVYPVIKKIY